MKNLIPFSSTSLQSFFDDEFFPRFQGMQMSFPSVDIEDKGDHLLITADVPGIDKKDLQVHVEDDVLVLSGKTEENKEEKKKHFYRKERKSGQFYREIALPVPVERNEVRAKFENGMVVVTLPKMDGSKEEKRTKVEVE